MTIMSNASPLINLARIGKLDLLHRLYDSVLIPQAVWDEVVVQGAGQPGQKRSVQFSGSRGAQLSMHNWHGRYGKIWMRVRPRRLCWPWRAKRSCF